MLERYTPRARQVIVLAQDEAGRLKHGYIGTEHLLLGLIREDEGIAARALESLGVSLEEVRASVARTVGRGDAPVTGQIPFTPRMQSILELALRRSETMGHDFIGTEHLLLALVHENGGVASRILETSGGDGGRVWEAVHRLMRVDPPPPWEPVDSGWSGLALAATLETSAAHGNRPPAFGVVLLAAGAAIVGAVLALGWLIRGRAQAAH